MTDEDADEGAHVRRGRLAEGLACKVSQALVSSSRMRCLTHGTA